MTITIRALELDGFDSLPRHSRRCVFWEVDPSLIPVGGLPDPEFEKEAWMSMVMLEWGTCALVAETSDRVVGTAFYAPPGSVPRSTVLPTAPVGVDAVLVTSIRANPGYDEVAADLLDATVADARRRGSRAIEAFGLVAGEDTEMFRVADECTGCLIPASLLSDAGFAVVAPHPRYPRMRLEIDEGLGWKAGVEGALERLLAAAAVEIRAERADRVVVPALCRAESGEPVRIDGPC